MREMYCITCPNGCKLTVYEHTRTSVEVEGNGCDKGHDYAVAEVTNATRSLTTTVRTTLPGVPVLPVRTDGEIPKGKIMDAMLELSSVVVNVELDCGDTVLEDVAGSGVRVIAASDILQRRELQFAVRNKELGLDEAQVTAGGSGFAMRDPKALDMIGGGLMPGDEGGEGSAADGEADGPVDPEEGGEGIKSDGTHFRQKGRSHIRR